MPSKKWQRLQQEAGVPFRRGRPQRPPAPAILVVTEGVVTEPTYLRELRRCLALKTLDLVIYPLGVGDPRKLAEKALGLKQGRKLAGRRHQLGISLPAGFDQIWIVFDTDVPAQHGRLHDGIAFAKANGIQCAHSTPCFEYWLLLHLDLTTAPMLVCAEAAARLAKELGKAYTKNGKDAEDLIRPLLAQLGHALTNAAQVRGHHDGAQTPFPANPSTEMDRLVLTIRDAASPAAETHLA